MAAILCIVCYFAESIPFSFEEPIWKFFITEDFVQKHINKNKEYLEDGLFINVGYDKAIAEIGLYDNLFTGRISITDRESLDNLLCRLQEDDSYKYIFLDVRFEKGIETPIDSQLFNRIAQMRDIVVANHEDIVLASPLLNEKAALSDYKMTAYSTGFSRYQYLQKGRETAPLHIYREITGYGIEKKGFLPIYCSKHILCKNTIFLRIPEDYSENRPSIEKTLWYDYGPQIDDDFSLKDLAKDKFVVIGDFVTDKSGTYLGEQPNPYLSYLATISLFHGYHFYLPFIFLLFVVLWFCSYYSIQGRQLPIILYFATAGAWLFSWFKGYKREDWFISAKKKIKKCGFLKWLVISFFSYAFFLSIACLFFFFICNTTFSIFISSLLLTLVEDAVSIAKQNKQNEE